MICIEQKDISKLSDHIQDFQRLMFHIIFMLLNLARFP